MKLVDIISDPKLSIYCFEGLFNSYLLKFDYKVHYQDIIVSITALKTKNIVDGPYYIINPNKFKPIINNFLQEKNVETFVSDYKIKLNKFNKSRYDVQLERGSKIYIYRLRRQKWYF